MSNNNFGKLVIIMTLWFWCKFFAVSGNKKNLLSAKNWVQQNCCLNWILRNSILQMNYSNQKFKLHVFKWMFRTKDVIRPTFFVLGHFSCKPLASVVQDFKPGPTKILRLFKSIDVCGQWRVKFGNKQKIT